MRLEELERELREERPEIEPDFATRLDEWAARGFPRGGELDPRRERRGRGPFGLLPARRPDPGAASKRRRRRRWASGDALAATVSSGLLLFLVVGVVALTQVETGGEDHAGDDGGEVAAESADSGRQEFTPQSGGDQSEEARDELAPAVGQSSRFQSFSDSDAGPNRRRQAQTVSLALATPPAEFRESADGVLGVVADHNGFVMNSSVSGGDPEVAGAKPGRAQFDLRIPAGQLQAALAALSDLGHLVSRTDGTRDITARFESAQDRIETFTATRDRLLRQLEEAFTETEQQSIRRRLRIVENQLENAREDLARAQQRVRMVPVGVTIAADESIEDESGAWGVGDAWGAARDVLRVALGVALIAAAVILPLALIALVAFLAWRLVARIGRERALDEL
ncbi:MAG TPA: DUF4349 domain-containing protein [Solirubrobacterales bacterium]|nr:DUF4349 domain-containing protein [Solirubrobacterales bacterium]